MTPINEINSTVYRRKCFLINLAYFLVIGAIVILAILYALSALMPFIIAAVSAAILRPALRFLNERLRLPRKPAGVALTVVSFLCIALLGLVLFNRLADRLLQMNIELNVSMDELLGHLGSDITSLSTSLLGMAGNFTFSLPSMLISMIICIVSTLFLLFDWDKIVDFFYLQLSGRGGDLTRKVMRQSRKAIRQFIMSYGLILLITFSELSVGFLSIGFDNALLLAMISVFDIPPVVGCCGVLIPWMLVCFIIGDTGAGIGLALLYVVITVVRNIAEPRIVGKQVGLHPLVTLMSMVIGSSLMGGAGLFGLLIALAVINKMNKDGVIHLYKVKGRDEEPRSDHKAT